MGDHNSLVKRLSEIIKQVNEGNTKEESPRNNRDITSLFPSLGGGTSKSETRLNHPYRRRFNSRAYTASSTSTSTNSKQSKAVCKDIILLPNPSMSTVPRFKVREELYARELVASAVIIKGELNEAEIRETFGTLFASKLSHIKGQKFEFVRAVGSKIVDPKVNRPWDGKMLKHIAGQGPVYIRSWEAIETDFPWVVEEVDEGNEFETEDDEGKSCSKDTARPHTSSGRSMLINLEEEEEEEVAASQAPKTKERVGRPMAPEDSDSDLMSSSFALKKVMCPTCHLSFPCSEIEQHADLCCDQSCSMSSAHYNNLMASFPCTQDNSINTEESQDRDSASVSEDVSKTKKEILEEIAKKVSENVSRIDVRRKHLWDDYADSRKRPWVKSNNTMKIMFIGEPAVDDGGPKREFFTEILEILQRKVFVSEEIDGTVSFVPCESTVALAEGEFKIAGELMASSIAQGGPPPNFLLGWVFNYLSTGIENIGVNLIRLQDTQYKDVSEKLENAATDKEIQDLLIEDEVMDVLASIGYRGVPQREKLSSKNKILRSMYIKAYVEPKLPMLSQLADGLKLFGVLQALQKYPSVMKSLFTAEERKEFTADDFLGMLVVTFSLGQAKKDQEIQTYKAFVDFVQSLQYGGIENCTFSVKDLLKFVSGCTQIPAVGFLKKISCVFTHGCPSGCKCRPTTSTCDLELRLPVHISSLEQMIEAGISMLSECQGFGNI